MRIISVIFAMFAVIAVAVIAFFALSMNEKAAFSEMDALEKAGPVGAKSAESAEIAKLTKRVKQLEEELAAAKAAAVATPDALPKEKTKGKGDGMMKTFAKMMEDPTMKDAIRGQQRVAVKGLFADFFAELGLSEEEEDAVTDLFLEKQMAQMQIGMGMMNKDVTEAERNGMAKELKEQGEEVDERIKEALGEDNFESYELFIDSMQERQQLSSFKEGLKGEGLNLSYDAEEQLMNAMYETRKEFKFSEDFGTNEQPNPDALAGMTAESVERMIGETRKLHEEIAGRAAGILSPEQMEHFRASQESQLKMHEMAMRMSLQMRE